MTATRIQRTRLALLSLLLLPWRTVLGDDGRDGDDSAGDPLYLTPLINSGRLNEARSRSQTGRIGGDELGFVLGYSGYLTVNREFNSNLFFWFIPALERPSEAPVLAWLQGGPGSSSLLGSFAEHGPYALVGSDPPVPARRSTTWTRFFSMLYVDEPVGAGFSFTESERGYARNLTDVARDMLEFLQQFFTLFPEYAKRDFYVTGESFAGKFVPATAFALHEAGDSLRVKIKLKGIAFGNGLTDPPSMIDFGGRLYQLGLVDRKQAAHFDQKRDVALSLINDDRYYEAAFVVNNLIYNLPNDYYNLTSAYFNHVTGYESYYNMLTINDPPAVASYGDFVQTPAVRRALHVGENAFRDRKDVVTHMIGDIIKSAKSYMPVLMENYKVLMYSGQLDIAVPYTATAQFVATIPWSGAEALSAAPRKIWRPSSESWWRTSDSNSVVFGYTRRAKGFREVMIRNAGHFAPHDQPEASLDMMTRFIFDLPFADGEDVSQK
ncbi:probable serine carboxypeptidase CPVL [Dermacentor albipictus]|uniref:probable serine carboxypeptidase CPVL n=1 Tax=Dermacentor albipictus TaxID=60249 RepID=UPI0031FD5DC0